MCEACGNFLATTTLGHCMLMHVCLYICRGESKKMAYFSANKQSTKASKVFHFQNILVKKNYPCHNFFFSYTLSLKKKLTKLGGFSNPFIALGDCTQINSIVVTNTSK